MPWTGNPTRDPPGAADAEPDEPGPCFFFNCCFLRPFSRIASCFNISTFRKTGLTCTSCYYEKQFIAYIIIFKNLISYFCLFKKEWIFDFREVQDTCYAWSHRNNIFCSNSLRDCGKIVCFCFPLLIYFSPLPFLVSENISHFGASQIFFILLHREGEKCIVFRPKKPLLKIFLFLKTSLLGIIQF